MAKAYTKEFLVDVYLSRYAKSGVIEIDQLLRLEEMANKFYDEVGKDKFRIYASVSAEAIKEYQNA